VVSTTLLTGGINAACVGAKRLQAISISSASCRCSPWQCSTSDLRARSLAHTPFSLAGTAWEARKCAALFFLEREL